MPPQRPPSRKRGSQSLLLSSSKRPRRSQAPSGGKKKKQLAKKPTPPPGAGLAYVPCGQTLFLEDDLLSFSFEPVQSSRKGAVNTLRALKPFGNDMHSYFKSAAAAKNAASQDGPLGIYRHIGHVTLRKFQQLEGLSKDKQWFPFVKTSTAPWLNLCVPIKRCWCENEGTAAVLESLSTLHQDPWPVPYILIIAKREHVVRACDVDNFDDDFDLDVQVYAGRLLFEIIACRDIRILFDELKSPVPYTPAPRVPKHPVDFKRSAPLPSGSRSFANILRDAESTGYASLTDEQREKVEDVLTVKLYPYQQQTVRWMLDKENEPHTLNDYFWEERSFTDSPKASGGKFFYFPMTGEVRLCRPPRTRGGMVTEEMGLGKTVEALALIAAQKTRYEPIEMDVWCEENHPEVRVYDNIIRLTRLRLVNQERAHKEGIGFQHGDEVLCDPDEVDLPGNVKVRRWPAKTTLVVCPNSLVGQWKHEVMNRAPSLSVALWDPAKGQESEKEKTAVGENAKDIVLATYEMVRSDPLLSKICWKRLILDEAQVTRRSSAQLAKDVFNLRSDTRFLMTGTPLVNSINDLKGQLAILKIWPFALEQDGFWETYVSFPFNLGCEAVLLRQLLAITMIRHSKAQRLQVSLSKRTYETVKVNLTGSYRACYYYVYASSRDELESQSERHVDTRRLRTLLKLILGLCLSPFLLDVVALDLVRRFTWSRKSKWSLSAVSRHIQKVTPQEAIQFVAESGNGVIRDSHRSFAVTVADSNALEPFLKMAMTELREMVVNRGLIPVKEAARVGRSRLAALAAGGIHRVATDNVEELRKTAIELGIASSEDVRSWSRTKARARLRLHYELQSGIQTLQTVHESGFSAITKLMEKKENPSCPVCLMECEQRVTVTKCGHIYCLDCMTMMLAGEPSFGRCAICRRELSPQQTVEITRSGKTGTKEEVEEEKKVTTLLTSGGTSKAAATQSARGKLSFDDGAGTAGTVKSEAHDEVKTEDETEVDVDQVGLTAEQAWVQFDSAAPTPTEFDSIGRNEQFPSLSPEFLRHLATVRSELMVPPKLAALLELIKSSEDDVKFCVVAGSVENLGVIAMFLEKHGIACVGAGMRNPGSGGVRRAMATAAEQFSTDANIRVYLLNPTNAAGLTLTAATVVVFMEALMRVADEIQAAARVHRIGQTKDVRIVRIVARNTLEEKIVARRGEINSAEEESQALSLMSTNEASDQTVLQLFAN